VAWKRQRSSTRGATASLDGVSTRGQSQIMGRDEETGFSGRTKKQPFLLALHYPVSLFDRRPFLRPDLPVP
jgi:hypothetical protein